jgi:hypothetical protein
MPVAWHLVLVIDLHGVKIGADIWPAPWGVHPAASCRVVLFQLDDRTFIVTCMLLSMMPAAMA